MNAFRLEPCRQTCALLYSCCLALGLGSGDDFDPVVIRIQDECNVFHLTIRQFLLKLDAELFKPIARLMDVVDGDAQVAETLGFLVSIMVAEVGVVFGTVVVREFENGFALTSLSDALLVLIREEVERKVATVVLVNQVHAEYVFVKVERDFRVLDSKHDTVKRCTVQGTSRLGTIGELRIDTGSGRNTRKQVSSKLTG